MAFFEIYGQRIMVTEAIRHRSTSRAISLFVASSPRPSERVFASLSEDGFVMTAGRLRLLAAIRVHPGPVRRLLATNLPSE